MVHGRVFGYVRVSTKEQNEDRQLLALAGFPVSEKFIFMDKQSGKDFNRPAYKKLLKQLHRGDLLVIKSIDRLGRNYEEIIEQWRTITKEKRADIVILDMPLLDTRRGKDLIGTLISDIVLQLLSYVAETERMAIRERQAEGIAAAKLKGVKFGRPRKKVPEEFFALQEMWYRSEVSSRTAACRLGISHDTFIRWAKEQRKGLFLEKETARST